MTRFDESTTARLRAGFAGSTDPAPSGTCVADDRIWMAVRGELAPDDTATVVLHTATCGACAEGWRIAFQARDEAPASRPRVSASPWTSPWVLGPGMAAAAVLILGLVLDRPPRLGTEPGSEQVRGGSSAVIQPVPQDGSTMSKEAFVLRWSGAPAGSRYEVRVTTEDLRPVAAAYGLSSADFGVDSERLASYPSGTRLLWQVVVISPDARRTTSPTFVVRLQ